MTNHPLNLLLPMGLRRLLRRLALATIPSMRHLDMPKRLRHMRTLGFRPRCILDVGAGHGEWARLAAAIWPEATIFGFEPNRSEQALLEKTRADLPQFRYFQAFLGPSRGTIKYSDKGHQTSLLDVQARSQGSKEAPMLVIDELIARGELERPDFIKIDVQGFELEVLKGAKDTLSGVSAVLLEVNFYRFDPETPTVDEVIDFMRERNFTWWDVMGILRCGNDDALAQMDLMFVKREHPLRKANRL